MKRSIAAMALAGTLALAGTAVVVHAQGPAFLKGQTQGELAIVRLAGTIVFNAKAERVGTIADVVLGADGKASTVVIAVGGVAGIGAKQVGLPFSVLKVGPVVEGSRVLLVDVTSQQLQAAPAYVATDPGRLERGKKRLADWMKVAKDKAVELGNQAGEAVQSAREKLQQSTPPASAPAPKQ